MLPPNQSYPSFSKFTFNTYSLHHPREETLIRQLWYLPCGSLMFLYCQFSTYSANPPFFIPQFKAHKLSMTTWQDYGFLVANVHLCLLIYLMNWCMLSYWLRHQLLTEAPEKQDRKSTVGCLTLLLGIREVQQTFVDLLKPGIYGLCFLHTKIISGIGIWITFSIK